MFGSGQYRTAHTHTSHTGIGAGSDDTALPQRPATTAPSATLSSQPTAQSVSTANMANAVVAPSPQLVSADSFPYRRRTLRDLESVTATLPTEQQGVAPVAELEDSLAT